VAINNNVIQLAIITTVAESGELMTTEVVENVAALHQPDDEADAKRLRTQIERQIIVLDRDGKLTRRNAESGWQITANGRSSLGDMQAKLESRYVAPYAQYAPVVATLEWVTATLGPITEPGEQGIAFFPRLKARMRNPSDKTRFIEPGGPMIWGGWIRVALMKSADQMDSTITIDRGGVRRTLPDVAWSHVGVGPIVFPPETVIGKSVRRPTNVRGQAVGEIIHESICDVVSTLHMTVPLSHFSTSYLVRLFDQVERTGISAAGMGKGGNWGLVICHSLVVDGKEVWPYPTAPSVTASVQTSASTSRPTNEPTPERAVYAALPVGAAEVDPRARVVGSVRRVNGAG